MERAELERLDRDTLIARADAAGIPRAHVLTRPELVDELLMRQAPLDEGEARRVRGLFGRARDLVARLVERGLNLPDAAERIRSLPVPAIPLRSAPSALPTVTLAEIYAAQGHRGRAIETLRGVLAREPEHEAARALLAQLEDATYAPAAPVLPPEDEEPPASPEVTATEAPPSIDAEPPEEPVVASEPAPAPPVVADACEARHLVGGSLLVRWSAGEATVAHRRATQPQGGLALRLLVIEPTWDGPRTRVHDFEVGAPLGERHVENLPPRYVARAAIGWRSEGGFVSIAHTAAIDALA